MGGLKRRKLIFGLEPNIFFAGLTSFFTDTSTKMVYSVMPLFLLSIGASKTMLCLIEGIAESTASLLKALSGLWSDKIGKNKPFMIIGYAITALITPMYAMVASPFQVLYLRFIERVGKGVRATPRDSLVAGSAGEKAGKSFGFHGALEDCGALLGPLLAYFALQLFVKDYRQIFLIGTIPALLGVINVILFIREAKKPRVSLPTKIGLRDFSKRYYLFLGIAFLFTLGNSTDALLLVKARDVGIGAPYIPLVYLLFSSVSVVFSVPMGMLSDKIGRERVIVFGYLLYAAVYFGFGQTRSIGVIVALFAFYGLYSTIGGVQKALVSDFLDKDKKGTGLGIYNSMLGITLLPASLIAGVLYDKVNSGAPFYFGAAMALLAAVSMLVFYSKRPVTGSAASPTP